MTQIITLEEYKEQLLAFYDPDDLVDVLEISSEELIEAFPDKVQSLLTKLNSETPESMEDM